MPVPKKSSFLAILFALLCRYCLASTCRELLKSISPNANELWIDSDTQDCTKTRCRLDYIPCLGAAGFPAPYGRGAAPPRTEDMVLVFSDEFNSKWRDFRPGKDAKWQALDLLYVNDDQAMFRSSAVTVRDGSAVITASRAKSSGPYSAPWGDQLAHADYTSGMLQGWNKFCFTGGYLEARIKMPGDDVYGGLWPALFTLGNLGRAGYLRSTDGMWPFSYDTCDAAATEKLSWTDHYGQRINRCNSTKGRGASEIDLFEIGVWERYRPQLSTSLHVAPVLPMGLHWLLMKGPNNESGLYYPTNSDPTLYSGPNGWAGVNSFMWNGSFLPRPGSRLADAISATHTLNATHFQQFYRYGFDWAPGRYLRWYINDILIYELNSVALQGGTNDANETVGNRLIPEEPSYININLAMSNSFAQINPDIPLPADMLIDYVRVYQSRSQINTGCDTPDYPSQAYIDANVWRYKVNLAGFEDFVGNSSVMGPTMEPPPPDHTSVIVGVVVGVGGRYLAGLAVSLWLIHRYRKAAAASAAAAAHAAAAAQAAAKGWTYQPPPPPPPAPGPKTWAMKKVLSLTRGSPAVNTRTALAPKKQTQVVPRPSATPPVSIGMV